MTVYQDGYYCIICKKQVRAKIAYSKQEQGSVAYCTECGEPLQRVIPQPFSTSLVAHTLGLMRGGPGQMNRRHESNPAAPANPQEAQP